MSQNRLKFWNKKVLLSCLVALYMCAFTVCTCTFACVEFWEIFFLFLFVNSKIGVYAGKTEVDLSTHIYYAIEIKLCLPYSGKFSKEKIFTNFAILQSPAKVFSTNFKHATPIMQPVLTLHGSFLPWKFPAIRYKVTHFDFVDSLTLTLLLQVRNLSPSLPPSLPKPVCPQ